MSTKMRQTHRVSKDDINAYRGQKHNPIRQLDVVRHRLCTYPADLLSLAWRSKLSQVWRCQLSSGKIPKVLLGHIAFSVAVHFQTLASNAKLNVCMKAAKKVLVSTGHLTDPKQNERVWKFLKDHLTGHVHEHLTSEVSDVDMTLYDMFAMFFLCECMWKGDVGPVMELTKSMAHVRHDERPDLGLVTALKHFDHCHVEGLSMADWVWDALQRCVSKVKNSHRQLVDIYLDNLLLQCHLSITGFEDLKLAERHRRYFLILLFAKQGLWDTVRQLMAHDVVFPVVLNMLSHWILDESYLLAVEVLECFYSPPPPLDLKCAFSCSMVPTGFLGQCLFDMRVVAWRLGLTHACIWLYDRVCLFDAIPYSQDPHPNVTLMKIYMRLFVDNDFSLLWGAMVQCGWPVFSERIHRFKRNVVLRCLLSRFMIIIDELLVVVRKSNGYEELDCKALSSWLKQQGTGF